MTAGYDQTGAFRGTSFTSADFTGAKFRDCDMRQIKITDSWLVDVNVSGIVGNFLVNDVDVTAFVEAQLDERHPERVLLRNMQTADDYGAMWHTIETLWSETVARAERLPEGTRHERVDDEWSFVETLRHLVFAVDVWVGRMILVDEPAFHPLGLPPTDYTPDAVRALGLDLEARPSYAVALAALSERRVQVRAVVDVVTDEELDEVRSAV